MNRKELEKALLDFCLKDFSLCSLNTEKEIKTIISGFSDVELINNLLKYANPFSIAEKVYILGYSRYGFYIDCMEKGRNFKTCVKKTKTGYTLIFDYAYQSYFKSYKTAKKHLDILRGGKQWKIL